MTLNLKYKGFNYPDFYNGEYSVSNLTASLPDVNATGANSVALTPDFGVDIAASSVYAGGETTDTTAALEAATAAATQSNFTSFVRPFIDYLYPQESTAYPSNYYVTDGNSYYNPNGYSTANLPSGVTPANVVTVPLSAYTDGDTVNYRGLLSPADISLSKFFGSPTKLGSYDYMIVQEAKAAQADGAAMFAVGTELDSLANDAAATKYWDALIADVRAVFSGKLTYSANWATANQVTFWSKLDYVGIDGYVPLSNVVPDAAADDNPPLASLVAAWNAPSNVVVAYSNGETVGQVTGGLSVIDYFDQLAQQSIGKQFLLSEFGFQNDTGAATDPTGGSATGVQDPTLQAELYNAFFTAWNQAQTSAAANGGMVDGIPYALTGAYIWEYDPDTSSYDPNADDYDNWTPSAQALSVIKAGFAAASPPVAVVETNSAGMAGYQGTPSAARGTDGVTGTGALAGDSDPSGTALTITAVQGGTIGTVFNTAYGSLRLNADGSYTYFVEAGALAAPLGAPPLDVITYTITDALGLSTTATLKISDYRDPAAVAEGATVQPGQTITATAGSDGTGALAGDTDLDGLTVTIPNYFDPTLINTPPVIGVAWAGRYGFVTINSDGLYTYVANSAASLATAFASAGGQPLVDGFDFFVAGGHGTYAVSSVGFSIYQTGAPAVLSVATSPSSNLVTGTVVRFTLTMSEAVTVMVTGGTPSLSLSDGGRAVYNSGLGSNTLVFSTTIAAGQNTAALQVTGDAVNGGTIQDASGCAADLSGAIATSPEIQADIEAFYETILGRGPDYDGLADWTQYLASGGSLAGLQSSLSNSAEAQADIDTLYQAVLSRPVDAGGLASFTQYLANGNSLASIRPILAASGEAQGDIGALYQVVLGRPADTGGLANFTQYLASGSSLSGVAPILAASGEAQADIQNKYQAVLGRPADGEGLAGFTQYLATGGSLAGLQSILANSAEAQADIGILYQAVLGRPADTSGLAAFTQYLAGGGSLAGLRSSLANSGEAQSDIEGLYQSVLGRAADSGGLANFRASLVVGGTLAQIRTDLATSGEAQTGVAALLQTGYGTAPSAGAVMAGQSQLADGLSRSDLNTQTLMLGPAPAFIVSTGGAITMPPADVLLETSGSTTTVSGFNPAADVLQLASFAFPSLSAVLADETVTGSGLLITSALDPSYSVFLSGVSQASMAPANIRFS